MLGAGSGSTGGDPVITTPQRARGSSSPSKVDSAAVLEELLSSLRSLPIQTTQPWHRKHPQDSCSIRSIIGIQVGAMEQVHGVDVSWLHHPNKDHLQRGSARPTHQNDAQSSVHNDARPVLPQRDAQTSPDASKRPNGLQPVTPATPSAAAKEAPVISSAPSTPSPHTGGKPSAKRPGLLNRNSNERINSDSKPGSRRSTSWISNISSKFSSQGTPERPGPLPTQPSASASLVAASSASQNGATTSPGTGSYTEAAEDTHPYVPSKPKESSFFSSLTRKLSAGSQATSIPKVQGKGGVCERRILNVDPNRQRCLVPEMDVSRLRKVSFCVDVEIAGGPRYADEDDDQDRKQKQKDVKLKERAEGEALKHPETWQDATDGEGGEARLDGKTEANMAQKAMANDKSTDADEGHDESGTHNAASDGLLNGDTKKKKTDEERKERREKRRRRAEENGSLPVEFTVDGDGEADGNGDANLQNRPTSRSSPKVTEASTTRSASATKCDRPTTDPVRIYRRCCQLRETPILKRITEQLMSPTCCAPFEPGVVQCLDLTGSRLQLADMATLGDWLAVVPVKKLLLEDADLSDEGLRCILSGLLATTKPQPTRRRNTDPKHRAAVKRTPYQERSGLIEKLTLKNNPRITRIGWKHISLFLYMCRSIKAIDLSMIQFPDTLPPSTQSTPVKTPHGVVKSNGQNTDAGETFFKCLSERLGGNQLEELSVSECGMSAAQIRKVVDAAIVCGITRLGLAGNHIDEQGLEHVLHYLRSGVCGGLDIGGTDLRGKLDRIADALNIRGQVDCWALSFAGCNLDTASLTALFPTLQKLPDLRFIDLSHNPDLCGNDNGTISLLRRHIGQMKNLKRIHLADVGMSPKQAIALADVLPEGPKLAHISILENREISALASAKDEAGQEEACALYASYMAAVRCSSTLICIDIDVPSQDNSEIVKALAKQVVAYSLRNMEQFALAETSVSGTNNAAATLTEPHGGEKQVKEIAVPDILMHLVGHVDGFSENHDNDEPAPDEDYIVGGTGVVKALQYCLGEKANDLRRMSASGTPVSGSRSPRERPGSSAGLEERQGKAKKMSTNLLESARKIRSRLQPAMVKEEAAGDELAYRRLLFLDETLRSMIQRFEEEYPETRIAAPSPMLPASAAPAKSSPLFIKTSQTEPFSVLDGEDEFEEDGAFRPAISRHNSDVSLASRALAIEEGHLHRLGQRLRRDVVDSPASAFATSAGEIPPFGSKEEEEKRLEELGQRIDSISGSELKSLVENGGWDHALREVGANLADLRVLQEQDPQGWEKFVESQLKARMNVAQDARET